MNKKNLIATAQTTIHAPLNEVWNALVNPAIIKKYMFGTTVFSDWKKGSKITWKGEWEGKAYEDKGEILEIKPNELLSYTHFSPLTGKPDIADNYHTVTIELESIGDQTKIKLTQDNNANPDAQKHSEKNWSLMLEEMKKTMEANA